MLDALQRYLHKRRWGIIQSVTFLCGSYAVSAYVSERLEEVKDKMLRSKVARDDFRRRFQSTHDDVCFTIMALIPTLASQVLEDMNVEALTNELESISRASRSRTFQPSQNQPRSQSVSGMSLISDVHSDPGSGSFFDGDRASTTSSSWIQHMSASEGPISRSDIPMQLSDSMISSSSSLSQNTENSATSASPRTKGQLSWNEVKIPALTRTLTTLYTITLLSLLTAVQLNVLGRSRYIDSVRVLDRAERARGQMPDFSLTGILAREAVAKIVDVEAITWMLGDSEDGDEGDGRLNAIPEGTELRILALSWWVLHVGWKDVAARIKSSVKSVFDDVPLKAKLSPSELSKLIMDVRRRVETDGTESKLGTRFLSTLLPPTPETTAHVLAQGGALSIPRETAIPIENPVPRPATFPTPPSSHAHEPDLSSRAEQSLSNSVYCLQSALSAGKSNSLATSRDVDSQFNALLAETRRYLSGPDFAYALDCALDRATEVLMDGLRARVFVDSASAVNVPNTEDAQAQAQSSTQGAGAGTRSENKDDIKIRLAGMLPGLARWSQLALNATPNELVDNIMAVREVNALEAIIISDYENRFPAIS